VHRAELRTVSATSLATVITRIAATAPSGCSVSVEIASPPEPSAAIAATPLPVRRDYKK
jgi:hypothetical protein